MTSLLERRRFNRIFVSLPVNYSAHLPDTDIPCQGQGCLRDISLSGLYFHMDSDTAFQQGQILCLSIAAPLQYLGLPTSFVQAQKRPIGHAKEAA